MRARHALVPLALALAPGLASRAPAREPVAAGPPCICFPIDIGSAESIPFRGKDPFDVDPAFPLAKVVPETLRVLGASEDPLVHMETIRRAAIYLSAFERRSRDADPKERAAGADALIQELESRAKGAESETAEGGDRGRGLRFFDAGYAVAAFRQVGIQRSEPFESRLDRAAALLPEDGAVQFGVALASFEGSKNRKRYLGFLRIALDRAGDREGLLRKNLVSTFGAFLGASSFEALDAKVREMGRAS